MYYVNLYLKKSLCYQSCHENVALFRQTFKSFPICSPGIKQREMKINGLNLSVDPNSAPYKFLSKAFILRYEKFSLMKFNVQRAIKYCVLVFYIQSCLYFKR